MENQKNQALKDHPKTTKNLFRLRKFSPLGRQLSFFLGCSKITYLRPIVFPASFVNFRRNFSVENPKRNFWGLTRRVYNFRLRSLVSHYGSLPLPEQNIPKPSPLTIKTITCTFGLHSECYHVSQYSQAKGAKATQQCLLGTIGAFWALSGLIG